MQQLHLVVQTFLTGLVLVMLMVVYFHSDSEADQPSVYIGAQQGSVLPKPAEDLTMPSMPVLPVLKNVGM